MRPAGPARIGLMRLMIPETQGKVIIKYAEVQPIEHIMVLLSAVFAAGVVSHSHTGCKLDEHDDGRHYTIQSCSFFFTQVKQVILGLSLRTINGTLYSFLHGIEFDLFINMRTVSSGQAILLDSSIGF